MTNTIFYKGKESLYPISGFCSKEEKTITGILSTNIAQLAMRLNNKIIPNPALFYETIDGERFFMCVSPRKLDGKVYQNSIVIDSNLIRNELKSKNKNKDEGYIFLWLLIFKIVRYQYIYHCRLEVEKLFTFHDFVPLDEYEAGDLLGGFLLKEIRKQHKDKVALKIFEDACREHWSDIQLYRAMDVEVVAAKAARVVFEHHKGRRKGPCWKVENIIAILRGEATQGKIRRNPSLLSWARLLFKKAA